MDLGTEDFLDDELRGESSPSGPAPYREDTLVRIHVEYMDTNGENKLRKHANGALRLPLSGLHAAARSARNATGKALPA